VPYERVDAVLDALKQSKVKFIYLLSDQKTVEN
jgi:biopolymer transport protein ExbD